MEQIDHEALDVGAVVVLVSHQHQLHQDNIASVGTAVLLTQPMHSLHTLP